MNAALHRELGLPRDVGLHYLHDDIDPLTRWPHAVPQALAAACPKRRREFLRGRYCAAVALRAAGCTTTGEVPIGVDKLPCWPRGWHGSISHAGSGAIAAVVSCTSRTVLGVDMECLIEPRVAEQIQPQIAQSDEFDVLSCFDMPRALTVLFSAKEALYKALYPDVRRFFDFSAARAAAFDANGLQLQLTTSWGEQWPDGTRVSVRLAFRDDYVITAVSVRGSLPTQPCVGTDSLQVRARA